MISETSWTPTDSTLGNTRKRKTKTRHFSSLFENEEILGGNFEASKKYTSYLVTFINVYGFILVYPFRVFFSKNASGYVVTSSKPRKILCFIFHICLILTLIVWVYPSVHSFILANRTVGFWFTLVSKISISLDICILLKIVWFNMDDLVELCNLTTVQCNPSRKRKLRDIMVFCLSNTVIVFYMIQGLYSESRIDMAYKSYRAIKPILYFLSDILHFNMIEWLQDSIGYDAVKYFGLSVFSFLCSFTQLSITTFLAIAITMNDLVTDGLVTYMKERSNQSAAKITMEYEKLRYTTQRLRETFGGFVIFYYVMGLAFFTFLPKVHIASGIDAVFLYLQLSFVSISLYLAMRASAKVEDVMMKFIQQRQQNLEAEFDEKIYSFDHRVKLMALKNELENCPIGVSCSLFTITKRFFTSTIGIVTTFLLVIVQTKN